MCYLVYDPSREKLTKTIRWMKRWGIPLVALAAVLIAGFWLWLPPEDAPNRRSDLGTALIGGAIVGVAILYLQGQLSRGAERRNLRLQLGLTNTLAGIDLSGRDLSGFYLPEKDLRGANLSGANLRGANLSGTQLDHADLTKADLRGTKLDATNLVPRGALVPTGDLVPGPLIPDASLQGVVLEGAKVDKHTSWPRNFDAAQQLER